MIERLTIQIAITAIMTASTSTIRNSLPVTCF